jgi:hypothetical protein
VDILGVFASKACTLVSIAVLQMLVRMQCCLEEEEKKIQKKYVIKNNVKQVY